MLFGLLLSENSTSVIYLAHIHFRFHLVYNDCGVFNCILEVREERQAIGVTHIAYRLNGKALPFDKYRTELLVFGTAGLSPYPLRPYRQFGCVHQFAGSIYR